MRICLMKKTGKDFRLKGEGIKTEANPSKRFMERLWNGGSNSRNRRGNPEEIPRIALNQDMNFEDEILLRREDCEDSNFTYF